MFCFLPLRLRARPRLIVPCFWRRRRRWRREVSPQQLYQFVTELLAQHAGADFFNFAFAELSELERAERDADEPLDAEPEMAEHIADLAILAFADAEREPHIAPLHAIERGIDRAIVDALDRCAAPQAVELLLCDRAMRAHAITPQPSGRRQLQKPRQRAVIGQKQKALGVEIQPPDADQAWQIARQICKDRRSALWVGMRCHQPARLVIEEEPRALARRKRFAIDCDAIRRSD